MIGYIFRRIRQRFWTAFQIRRHSCAPGFFRIGTNHHSTGTVVFDLSDPAFVHLGDQLFYLPTVHEVKAAGLPVAVMPTKPLESFFAAQGFEILGREDLHKTQVRLRVMPLALYDPKQMANHDLLLVDFASPKITQVLPRALSRVVGEALSVPLDNESAHSNGVKYRQVFSPAITVPTRSVIFSNYVDSGRFRMRQSYFDQLDAKARELKAAGHYLIHVGSARDKALDSRIYDFIDLDLRGLTTPIEVIGLLADSRLETAVTFDNFVMHAALLAGKPVFCKFRGRFTRAAFRHHIDNVNPALNPDRRDLITYL